MVVVVSCKYMVYLTVLCVVLMNAELMLSYCAVNRRSFHYCSLYIAFVVVTVIKFSRNGPERRSTTCVWCSATWNCHSTTRSTTKSCHSTTWKCRSSVLWSTLYFFGQLILWKIVNIVATTCQILRLKYTKFDFGCSSAPDPARGPNSTAQNP